MKRPFLILVLIAATVVVGAPRASACSCVAEPGSKKGQAEALKGSDAAFAGTVVSAEGAGGVGDLFSSGGRIAYTFDVDAVVKGSVTDRQEVGSEASGASCGYVFAEGRRYLVFAYATDEGLDTGLCMSNRELDVDEELPFPARPVSAGGAADVASDPTLADMLLDAAPFIAAGVVGLAFVGLLARRRSAARS